MNYIGLGTGEVSGLYLRLGLGISPAVVTGATSSVGGVGQKPRRRQRYLIAGRHLMLTEDELRAYLLRMLRRKQQERKAALPAPQKARPVPPTPDEPIAAADFGLLSPQMQVPQTYIQVANDLARQSWAQSQPEIIGMLHRLALGMEADAMRLAEEDDEDVLLLM